MKDIKDYQLCAVSYIPLVRADREWDKGSYKLKFFEGRLENFNPAGKTVFYNEELDQVLAIQYSNIVNILPIEEYGKKYKKQENETTNYKQVEFSDGTIRRIKE